MGDRPGVWKEEISKDNPEGQKALKKRKESFLHRTFS